MTTTELPGRVDLSEHGIDASGAVYRNPSTSLLYTHALQRGDGRLAEGGPLVVDTGRFTGRSPKDKFLVEEPSSSDRIWWGEVNQQLSEEHFAGLREKVTAHLGGAEALYVVDAWAGADPAHRIGVRVVTAHPYHALFAKTMFIDLADGEADGFAPDAVVLHAPELEADPEADGTRTGTFVALHPGRTEVLVGGTFYAGEIKKSIFTRHERPAAAARACSRCTARRTSTTTGRVAVFFGLSGTGKTTLSADPSAAPDRRRRARLGRVRRLQHRGRVLREGDPALAGGGAGDLRDDARRAGRSSRTWRRRVRRTSTSTTSRRPRTRAPPTSSSRSATRCPPSGPATRSSVVFLTADAFGILPPIARLVARSGALLLPLRLHGEARGHRDRRHRAAADLLDLFRRSRSCPSRRRSTRGCSGRSSTPTARPSGS